MPTLTLTDAAVAAIRFKAADPLAFKQTGVRLGPNEWRVPFEQETIDRIRESALPGETDSDTILRICATADTPGLN